MGERPVHLGETHFGEEGTVRSTGLLDQPLRRPDRFRGLALPGGRMLISQSLGVSINMIESDQVRLVTNLFEDSTGNNVAGRQIRHLVVPLHEGYV